MAGMTSGSRAHTDHDPRVVVGVDGSPGSRAALEWAVAEAVARGAGLEVLATYPVDLYWTDPYLADPRRVDAIRANTIAGAEAMVQEVREATAGAPGAREVPIVVRTAAGRPAEHLVHEAAGADLLVVGSRGRSPMRSSLLGSVALHCAAHAPCAVVVVHTQGNALDGPVVVGIDNTEVSKEALRRAIEEAVMVGAALHVVAAYEPFAHWYWSDGGALVDALEPSSTQVEDRARTVIDEVLAEFPSDGRPEILVSSVEGIAGDVLVQHGDGARLLVVGSRGRSQLTGMVLGSVALHCVVSAPCPVMVVHPAPRSTAHDPASPQAQSVPTPS